MLHSKIRQHFKQAPCTSGLRWRVLVLTISSSYSKTYKMMYRLMELYIRIRNVEATPQTLLSYHFQKYCTWLWYPQWEHFYSYKKYYVWFAQIERLKRIKDFWLTLYIGIIISNHYASCVKFYSCEVTSLLKGLQSSNGAKYGTRDDQCFN